jgi:hypothetical protein
MIFISSFIKNISCFWLLLTGYVCKDGTHIHDDNIIMEIRKQNFRWMGHTPRKDDEQPSKVALQWNLKGNRERGRPRKS